MSYICIVPGCTSKANVPSHRFSKEVTKSVKWQELVQSPKFAGLSVAEVAKFRICYKHFSQDCYVPGYRTRKLKFHAIPSLNLSLPMAIANATKTTGDQNVSIEDVIPESMNIRENVERVEERSELLRQDENIEDVVPESMNIEENVECIARGSEFSRQNCTKKNTKKTVTTKSGKPNVVKKRIVLLQGLNGQKLSPQSQKLYKAAKSLQVKCKLSKKKIVSLKKRLEEVKEFVII